MSQTATALPTIQELQRCVSFETAFMVDDYPYGFTLRTKIKYWIETREGHGMRYVTCTLNPKTGNWNKPKPSTYSDFLYLRYDENNYITCSGFTANSSEELIKRITKIQELGLTFNPITDEKLRYKYAALLKIEYGWNAKKYSEQAKPAFVEWTKKMITDTIKGKNIFVVLTLPAPPVPDIAEVQ